MSSAQSWHTSWAEVVSVCQTMKEDLPALLDPETGFAPRLRDLCFQQLEELSQQRVADPSIVDTLTLEMNTWCLLQALIPARISSPPTPLPKLHQILSQNPYSTPSTLAQSILASSPLLTELVVVREWLHDTSSPQRSIASGRGMMMMPEATTGYWRFTKVGIMQAKRMAYASSATAGAGASSSASGGLVMEMDPDAPGRTEGKKALAADDAGHEKNLMQSLYAYIRAGRVDDAAELCKKSHQPWRSASIRGMKLFGWKAISRLPVDSDEDEDDDDDPEAWYGNPRRQLWKTTCTRAALNPILTPQERALYAALAPSPATYTVLKSACRTWEDHLWAQVSVLCEEKQVGEMKKLFEKGAGGLFWESGGRLTGIRSIDLDNEAQGEEGDAGGEEEEWEAEVKGALQGLRDIAVDDGPAADHAYHVSQLQIILDRTTALIEGFAKGLSEGEYVHAQSSSEMEVSEYISLTRFFAHLCLYLQMVDQPVPPEAMQVILEAYLRVLESTGNRTLIATYAASLGAAAIDRYALFLSSLPVSSTTRQERKEALWRAKDKGVELDVVQVALRCAERCVGGALEILPNLKNAPLPSLLGDHREQVEREPSEGELMLLRSIEWTIFMKETYPMALEQANVTLRYFLGSGRLHLARELLGMLPTDLSAIEEPEQTATEYLHYRQFFMVWEVLEGVSGLEADVLRYDGNHTVVGVGGVGIGEIVGKYKELVDKAYELGIKLLTSEWLVSDVEVRGGDRRRRELIRVRQIFVPELVIRIHFLLVNSRRHMKGNLKRTMDMANIVADSRYKLYEDFVGGSDLGDPAIASALAAAGVQQQSRRGGSKRLSDYLEAVRKAVLCGLEDGAPPGTGGISGGVEVVRGLMAVG